MARAVGAHRSAARNRPLVRIVVAQFLGGTAEWGLIIALLVHAFERGGARATGLTSIATFVAPLVAAPLVAVACGSHRLQTVRRAGLAVCAIGSAASAAAVLADWSLILVALFGVLGIAGLTALAATGCSLLPPAVHTPRELVVGNLWLGHGAAVCVLLGPLFASGLLALGSPATALLGGSALAVAALLISCVDAGPTTASYDAGSVHPVRQTLDAARALVRRPGGVGLVAVSFGRQTLIGALDVLIVVIGFEAIDVGGTGSALLNASFGLGAALSVIGASFALRGARLALPIVAALSAAALLCVLLSVTLSVVAAFLVLTALGLSAAIVNTLSRMLLQRSADPASLGQVFGLLALTDGVALIVGSVVAQVVLANADVERALLGVGALVFVISAASVRSVWRADAAADIPVVEMSLLRPTPIFGSLPPFELESLARASTYVEVQAASIVVRQGDAGDRFYVVAGGEFDVVMSGTHIRTARRGHTFGEVALLADVRRTATVTAATSGVLLTIDREAFLTAITGSATSSQVAWGTVRAMVLDTPLTGLADPGDVIDPDATVG